MNWKTILLPILAKLVRMALLATGGYLVRKGWIEAKDSESLATYVVDMLPALIPLVPGVLWDLYAWLEKFRFIARVQEALHLPQTGRPAAAVVAAAVDAKDTASAVFATVTSIPVDREMFKLPDPPARPREQI